MKAYRFDSFDSLDELRVREEADPRPQRGEALVRVRAVSLNFRDIAMLRGRYPRKCLPGLIPVSDAAGHSVLVQGSGGVSIFVLRLARAVGATVIATTSSASQAGPLKSLGAAEVVNYVDDPQWGKSVRALIGGRGVDRVVEVGGPGTIAQSLRAVALGGEIASIGFLSTDNPGIDFFQLKLSGAGFRNIAVGDRAGLQDLTRAVAATGLKPVIDSVVPFDQAREAFAHLESGSHPTRPRSSRCR
jgi:alcohol dehydrogenase